MDNKLYQLEQQIIQLQTQLDMLRSSATLPYDVEQAFKARIITEFLNPSTKTAASETQAVDEGGSATYDVAKPMDGFEERIVDGQTRYYPYYT
jgi:hypothetical protein